MTIDYGLYPMQSYQPGIEFDHVVCDWPNIGRQAAIRIAQLAAGQTIASRSTLPVSLHAGQTCVPYEHQSNRAQPEESASTTN